MDKTTKEKLKKSEKQYDRLHVDSGFSEEMESYEVVATLLKGKKAVDIGCGSGYMERLFPDDITGVDFSKEALKIAKKNGAKHLVHAPAENLPFKDNEFEISASFGVLEHVVDQLKAVQEMARVSKVQILIVHASLPYGLELVRPFFAKLLGLKDQPIEKPFSMRKIKKMVKACGLKLVFQGFWNYIDLRWIWKRLPYGLIKWPSCHLLVTIKSENINRVFMKGKKR